MELEIGKVYKLNGIYEVPIETIYLGRKMKKGLQRVLAGIEPNYKNTILIKFKDYKIKGDFLEIKNWKFSYLNNENFRFGHFKDYCQARYIRGLLKEKGVLKK